ncbi:hypothetical protein EDB83DRAFT_2322527 [Lactarius deliciosus]|nr:hypothetical protein EDB83DRAFT_2322527 [Lactarius deliciosus]
MVAIIGVGATALAGPWWLLVVRAAWGCIGEAWSCARAANKPAVPGVQSDVRRQPVRMRMDEGGDEQDKRGQARTSETRDERNERRSRPRRRDEARGRLLNYYPGLVGRDEGGIGRRNETECGVDQDEKGKVKGSDNNSQRGPRHDDARQYDSYYASNGILRVASGVEQGRWAMRRDRGVEGQRRHEAWGRAACLRGTMERLVKGLSTAVHGGERRASEGK